MKKIFIFNLMIIIFVASLILGGCVGGITPSPTPSSSTGGVYGIVTEKGTGTPLSDVSISVDGTPNTTTLSDGSYTITGLTPGFHTLKFEKIGYKTETANVNVVAGTNTPQAAELENTRENIEIYIHRDTYIISDSNVNYGGAPYLNIGLFTEAMEMRMLISFNLDFSIIGDLREKNVISAKLKLYKYATSGGSSLTVKVYPLTEEWREGEATWSTRQVNIWFKEGGTYDETQLLSTSDIPTAGIRDWVEIDITKAFEYWKTHDNYGLIFIPSANIATQLTFVSSENSTDEEHSPYIEVEYYEP